MHLFIVCLSILTICFTLIPLIKHEYWIFRIFDYPRLQKLVLSICCLTLWLAHFDRLSGFDYFLSLAILANVIYLCAQILPFTPLSKKQVLTAKNDLPEQSFSIMIANVYEDNQHTAGCLQVVAQANPDIILLLETNKRWEEETSSLADHYPYHVKIPLENTYGMLLYARLPLDAAEVKYLVEKDIPSIHCYVTLKSGKKIRLHAVHPTPPVPNENPRSTERDKELLLVAELAKESNVPVVVIGDLNDVAWSYTTELFLKMSGLLDPRRGRGFFNTFHAHYPFMRFPLDHAFISTDFKLKELRRLPNFDSDHFPIFIRLQYEAQASNQQESLQPEAVDLKEANDKKNRDTGT